MLHRSGLSEAKRALLEKYLRGDIPQPAMAAGVGTQHAEAEVDGPRERVVAIQADGSKRPFFFLHGDWTGNAFFCFPLAHNLGSDQPFYMLEPFKFDDLQVLPTLEAMAAADLKLLRTVQSEGPYLLGGFCNGGLVAYEMARQLHAEGQTVDLLILMDSIPARLRLVCRIINRFSNLMRLSQVKQLDWFLRLRHIYRYLLDRRSRDFEDLRATDPRLGSIFPPAEALREDYPGVFTWATSSYVPSFYPGKVTLFWERAEPFRREWWHKWSKDKDREVEVHIIPGTHKTCRTEYVYEMAEHLRTCLSKIQPAASS